MPYVADAILTGNQGGKNPLINLRSLAIGNGVGGDSDESEDTRRELDFMYGHGSVSYTDMQAFWAQCGPAGNLTSACENAAYEAERNVGLISTRATPTQSSRLTLLTLPLTSSVPLASSLPSSIYNVRGVEHHSLVHPTACMPRLTSHVLFRLFRFVSQIYDTCPHDLLAVPIGSLSEEQLGAMGAPLFAPIRHGLQDLGFVCVLESESSDYLNTQAVQTAIHTTVANVSTWGPCGNSDKAGRHAHAAHRRALEKAGLMRPSADPLGDLYKKLIPEIPILSQPNRCSPSESRASERLTLTLPFVLLRLVYSGDVEHVCAVLLLRQLAAPPGLQCDDGVAALDVHERAQQPAARRIRHALQHQQPHFRHREGQWTHGHRRSHPHTADAASVVPYQCCLSSPLFSFPRVGAPISTRGCVESVHQVPRRQAVLSSQHAGNVSSGERWGKEIAHVQRTAGGGKGSW